MKNSPQRPIPTDQDVLDSLHDLCTATEIAQGNGEHRALSDAEAKARVAEIRQRVAHRSGSIPAVTQPQPKLAAGARR